MSKKAEKGTIEGEYLYPSSNIGPRPNFQNSFGRTDPDFPHSLCAFLLDFFCSIKK